MNCIFEIILWNIPILPVNMRKLKLWKEYEHNRDGYTNAKAEFVKKYTNEAKLRYGNRY